MNSKDFYLILKLKHSIGLGSDNILSQTKKNENIEVKQSNYGSTTVHFLFKASCLMTGERYILGLSLLLT